MRAQRHQVGGKRPVGGHQRFHAHRRGDVGGAHQHVEIGEGQHQHAEHPVGAVDQRQSLLGAQRDGSDAGSRHRLGALTFADQGKGNGGERGEIAAGTQRTVFVNRRDDVGVQQGEDRVDHHLPHTREPHRQRARPQQHHRPHDFCLDERPHAGRMRSDEGALQLLASFRWDHRRRQRTEAGGDAVHRSVACGQTFDDRRAASDRDAGRFRHADPGPPACDGDDIVGSDASRTEDDIARREFHQSVTYVARGHRVASAGIRIGG